MPFIKKTIIPIILAFSILMGWLTYQSSPRQGEEAKNIFDSSLYLDYRMELKHFISSHPHYEKVKRSFPTPFNLETAVQSDKVMQDFDLESFAMGADHSQKVKAAPIANDYESKDCVTLSASTAVSRFNTKVKAVIEEIENLPVSAEEQRSSHESLIKKIRDTALLTSPLLDEEQDSKKLINEIVNWLFLKADLKPNMQNFLFQSVPPPTKDLLAYLENTQKILHDHPQFYGIKTLSSYEDQLLQGNLPSSLALVNQQTTLIRIGQPMLQPSRALWWWSSPQASPEFLLFLQNQPQHFYVNLMKRKGVEGPLSHALEELEGQFENFSIITFDKNSSFYWQHEKDYPELLESLHFKQTFLDNLCASKGNYFWSKRLTPSLWKEELQGILNHVHLLYFHNQDYLTRKERKDFIELTYLEILNHLVEKWKPTSMNITCRQGMDRGPSLMVLWMLQKGTFNKGAFNKGEIAALLLAPPLLIHNRPSQWSKIERFISAAERLEVTETK